MHKRFQPVIRLWSLLEKKDKKLAFFIFGYVIIGTILELIGIGLIIPIFAIIGDEKIVNKYPILLSIVRFIGSPSHKVLIIYTMSFLLTIYIIKAAFLSFSAYIQSKFIYQLSAKTSSKLFKLYLFQPYAFHLGRNSAELIRIVSTDVAMLASTVQSATIVLAEFFVLLGLFLLLVFVEPTGAVISISVLSISAWLFHILTKSRIIQWGIENQLHGSKKFQHIQQGLSAAKDVKLLGREKEFTNKYDYHNEQIALLSERQYTISQFPRLFIELLAILGLISLVISMILLGRNINAILPTLALFAAAAFRLMPSVTRILSGIQTIQYSLPSINTLYSELRTLLTLPISKTKDDRILESEIIFDNISFKYQDSDKNVLQDVSFCIKKGESVGIIGGSGAGKSTLIDILLGLLLPSSGVVRVDDVDIQNDLRNWQDQIGYVPQTIYLTDDTLRRNIAFGIPDDKINEGQIINAVKSAQLESYILKLKGGLDTEVGERGVRLSGGQRQRIGIARALYHNPQVLVLDEATSSLDYATENGVMESINALHGQKTIVIVAHRLSTVERCDRIMHFDHGKLIEEGSAEEILKKHG